MKFINIAYKPVGIKLLVARGTGYTRS